MLYKNINTGEVFTEKEIMELCEQFYAEADFNSPDEYFEFLLDNSDIREVE